MAYDFKPFDTRIKEIGEHLAKELGGVRTGRAAIAVLDGVQVEAYGSRMPLNQVANISIEDARTLRIAPWDASQIKEIEKALQQANLGLALAVDEKGVRVSFPELTSERRVQLVKLAKEKMEASKTALRQARDEVWSDIQQKERDSEISEDDKFRHKDEMQKKVDAANVAFDEALARKEKEIAG